MYGVKQVKNCVHLKKLKTTQKNNTMYKSLKLHTSKSYASSTKNQHYIYEKLGCYIKKSVTKF